MGIIAAVCNIIKNGIFEHQRFLLNKSYLVSVVIHINIFYVSVINKDIAFIFIIISHQQIDKRRFSGARSSDYAYYITLLNGQVYIAQRFFGTVKREIDVSEFNFSLYSVRNIALPKIVFGFSVEYIKNLFC